LRRLIVPSPLPRLPIVISFHQFARLDAQSLGQFAKRTRLGTPLFVLQFVDVVECHPASLAQLTQTEHPAPSKLPQLCPVYLNESLNHNQHFTYFLLTNQAEYEKIWVSQKDGPGGASNTPEPGP
jgi:hypothetical protein